MHQKQTKIMSKTKDLKEKQLAALMSIKYDFPKMKILRFLSSE